MAKKTEKPEMAEKSTTNEGKLKALGLAMDQITKQFGDGSIRRLGDTQRVDVELVSSGSLSVDLALGGGYPKGRIIEIYGPESSGKTTLTLHAIAEVQKRGGTAAFIDAEHALDPAYARRLGVDTDNLYVSQPDNGEQALEIAETLVRSNAVDLVVVDSVAALVPQAEIDGDMGDSHMGLQARLMSQALRKLTGIINKSKTTVIFINQIRMKIGVMFGNPETTTGGNALKFYASVRLDIRRTGQIKVGEDIVGNRTKVKIVKNKIAPPFRVAEFDIMYNEGISKTGDVLDLAVQHGIVGKAGAWFDYNDAKIGQGREASKVYLKENPDVLAEIEGKVRAKVAEAAGDAEPMMSAADEAQSRLTMKITGITAQQKDKNRVNIMVDGKYRFSLDIFQYADLGIKIGKEYTDEELHELETESQFGKVYARALEYCLMRPHSAREVRDYLYRKTRSQKIKTKTGELRDKPGVAVTITERVFDRLVEKGYIDDEKFTRYWVDNRSLTKGASRRKLQAELRQKGIESGIIDRYLIESARSDETELQKVITKKRARYSDNQKFMQYLARQGFSYDDIKQALSDDDQID